MQLELLSVTVAIPRQIGERFGAPVISGIDKQPIDTPTINVLAETLEGDLVADPSVHGGVSKSIYTYPADHWDWWTAEAGLACRPGAFGENLTVRGAAEHDIHIGDRFSWGQAILEVSQPRAPCYKLNMHTGKPDTAARMTISAKCGWYFRVIQQGAAPATGQLERITSGAGASIHDTFMAAMDRRYSADARRQIASEPTLAPEWRAMISPPG